MAATRNRASGIIQYLAMSSAYAPPPPPSQSSAYPPAVASSGSRKKIVWIVLAAVLGGVLLLVLFIVGIVAVVFASIRSSEPFRHAVQVASHDPRSLSMLGGPVKPGWLVSGNISVQNDSGQADLSIPVQGSTHKGTIHVVAKKSQGEWTYDSLVLEVEDGPQHLDLLHPSPVNTEEK